MAERGGQGGRGHRRSHGAHGSGGDSVQGGLRAVEERVGHHVGMGWMRDGDEIGEVLHLGKGQSRWLLKLLDGGHGHHHGRAGEVE